MTLRIAVQNVFELDRGIWALEMPPHQVRSFGNPNKEVGNRSVIIIRSPKYNKEDSTLNFAFEDIIPINIGLTSSVVAISDENISSDKSPSDQTMQKRIFSFGRGDREFLELAKLELSSKMSKVAEKLLFSVRGRYAGSLKRGKSKNFSETPDNFWYVIIQPRIDELSITVRGPVDHFKAIAKIEIKDDRGNTRFKVRSESDIPYALELIFHAIKRG